MILLRILIGVILAGGISGAAYGYLRLDREIPDALLGFIGGAAATTLAIIIVRATVFVVGGV